jgi:hypothetical protein
LHIDTAYATIRIVPHGTFIHMEGNTMPRGVYDRSKAKPRKRTAPKQNLTLEGDLAAKWVALRAKVDENFPFKLTNPQLFSLLIDHYENTKGDL